MSWALHETTLPALPASRGIPSGTERWISPSPNALTHNGSGAAGWGSSTSVMDMGSVGASLLALGYRN